MDKDIDRDTLKFIRFCRAKQRQSVKRQFSKIDDFWNNSRFYTVPSKRKPPTLARFDRQKDDCIPTKNNTSLEVQQRL